jgi:hypothetical protein
VDELVEAVAVVFFLVVEAVEPDDEGLAVAGEEFAELGLGGGVGWPRQLFWWEGCVVSR